MSKSYISKQQLVKLQTLWHQAHGRALQAAGQSPGLLRYERLTWATQLVGREVRSFNELTRKEAARCIDALSGADSVHHGDTEARRNAQGTEGRKNRPKVSITLAGAEDLARIQDALTRLGWDEKRFEAWLRSPTSPLIRKSGPVRFRSSNPQIRTRGEANRVWWALKRLLKRAGAWHPAERDNSEQPAGPDGIGAGGGEAA